ncbi:unnamed protein product [Rotaria magnacalcarata]|uniref:Fascin-like domain-containing protein n=2 Tax=Rotaria magnacalcarata TaxID=392030 RepID=A0A819ESZ6_9BILA|nr:unnamed protein product [Rotaria magnacalcarata]
MRYTDFYLTLQHDVSLIICLQVCTGPNYALRDPISITSEGSNQAAAILNIDSSGLGTDPGRERSNSRDEAQYYIRAFHGRYVAAHPDGQLVTDDEDIKHHDIQWMIINREYHKVALRIVKHGTFLSAEEDGAVRCSDRDIQRDCLWEMKQLENGKYAFHSNHHRWLTATGMTDATPPEQEAHLLTTKEKHYEQAQFDVIEVEN